jgi:stage II sporulation protein D
MNYFSHGFLITSALLAMSLPFEALAFDMTQSDQTQTLYSNQLVFDRNGEPLVSVRVSEGQSEVVLNVKKGIRMMPSGIRSEHFEFPRTSKWRLTVKNGAPAKVRIWLNIGSVRADQFTEIKQLTLKATSLGLEVKRFEAGSVMGLSGQTLDTRQIILAVGPYADPKAAKQAGTDLKTRFGRELTIFNELLRPATGQIVARELRTGVQVVTPDVLWIKGLRDGPIFFERLSWGQGTPQTGVEARSYSGRIYATVDQSGKLAIVNVLSAERLLEGVVPSELYSSAPLNALKAQAVAARGQLLAKIGTRHLADPYLLCAETHCQVYTGRARLHQKTTKAVNSTRGQLLFDRQGLVDTTYSSTCGGHSESSHLVWGGRKKAAHPGFRDQLNSSPSQLEPSSIEAFVTTAPESFCKKSGQAARTYRWKKTVRGSRIAKNLLKFKDIGAVLALKVVSRGRSGRALSVRYTGVKGTVEVEGEYTNRKILGHLKSGLWIVSPKTNDAKTAPTSWSFTGAGFGHGVGLCQHGAMGMANQGHEWKQILFHYYRGSSLRKAW